MEFHVWGPLSVRRNDNYMLHLLRNAYTTINACQTTLYFDCPPPVFEDWIQQGPKAQPMPEDIIFPDEEN